MGERAAPAALIATDILQTIDRQPRLTAGLRAYRTHVLRQLKSLRRQIGYAAKRNFADLY